MGEPRVFNTSIYQRALTDIGPASIKIKIRKEGEESNGEWKHIESCDVVNGDPNSFVSTEAGNNRPGHVVRTESRYFPIGSSEIPDLEGKYWYVDDVPGYIIQPLKPQNVEGIAFWMDSTKYKKYALKALPKEVSVVLGLSVEADSDVDAQIYRSLKVLYDCEDAGNQDCVKEEKGRVMDFLIQQTKMECQNLSETQNAKIAKEREKNRETIAKAGDIRKRAIHLVSLAEKDQMRDQDINPDEMKRVFNKYYGKAPDLENITEEDAEAYYTNAQNMFAEMVTTKSGALTVKYSGPLVQCRLDQHPPSNMPGQSGEKNVPAVVCEIICEGISMSHPRVIISEGRRGSAMTASR